MAGLVQAIHAELSFYLCGFESPRPDPRDLLNTPAWVAGTSPAMTARNGDSFQASYLA